MVAEGLILHLGKLWVFFKGIMVSPETEFLAPNSNFSKYPAH